jgi:hypothetical protein
MVLSRIKNYVNGTKSAQAADKTPSLENASSKSVTEKTNNPDSNRSANSEMLKAVPRPEAKSVKQLSHFNRIDSPESVDSSTIIDKTGAKKILSRFSIGDSNPAFSCNDGNHLAIFCGESDVAQRNGLRSIFGGFFGLKNLFTGFNPRVALNYISNDGIYDLVDQNETKMDKSQLKKGVQSGEFKLVYIYQSGDGKTKASDQKFDREPLAIVVLHDYDKMLEQVGEKFSSRFPNKEIQEKFQAQMNKLKNKDGLKNIYACETILFNPKKKEEFNDQKASGICKNVTECMPPKTTLVFPRSIVGEVEAQSKNKRYTEIDWRHLENKNGKWDFKQKPITIVRDIDHGSDPIPEEFLTVNQFHNMSKVKDPSAMDPETISKIVEAQEFNKTTLADYDGSVTGKNPEETKTN